MVFSCLDLQHFVAIFGHLSLGNKSNGNCYILCSLSAILLYQNVHCDMRNGIQSCKKHSAEKHSLEKHATLDKTEIIYPKNVGHKWQWISHRMNNRHPWQLKKIKSWDPFWSYQLNSTADLANLAQF